jgi:uncharacterized protein (TIGR00255 family)
MTGFARGAARGEWGDATLELRSINHRYLETHFRLPESLRALETGLRQLIAERIQRGKVDVSLRLERSGAGVGALRVNEPLLAEVIAVAERVAGRIGGAAPISPLDVLRWPGVVSEKTASADELEGTISDLMNAALDHLVANRRAEGERLEGLLRHRAAGIGAHITAIRARLPVIRDQLQTKLQLLRDELGQGVEEERFHKALVAMAQKIDVAEELDRLDSHITALDKTLKRSEPVGRRLDFLMQEFNREANTLTSKIADAETTQAAVEIKVLIEQMREQVQNVE